MKKVLECDISVGQAGRPDYCQVTNGGIDLMQELLKVAPKELKIVDKI